MTPRHWVIVSWRFDTTLWSHLQGSKCPRRMRSLLQYIRRITKYNVKYNKTVIQLSLRVPANPVISQGISRIYVVERSEVFTVVFIVHYGQIFVTVKIPFVFHWTVEQVANTETVLDPAAISDVFVFAWSKPSRSRNLCMQYSSARHNSYLTVYSRLSCSPKFRRWT